MPLRENIFRSHGRHATEDTNYMAKYAHLPDVHIYKKPFKCLRCVRLFYLLQHVNVSTNIIRVCVYYQHFAIWSVFLRNKLDNEKMNFGINEFSEEKYQK